MLKCEKVMTKEFIHIGPQAKIKEAIKCMKDNNLDSIPVVDGSTGNKLLGQITATDILMKVYAQNNKPENMSTEEVMIKNVVIVGEETSVDDALLIMLKTGVRRLPVVDRSNCLAGILTVDALKNCPELKFSWNRLFQSCDSSMFESNFERNREAYEGKMEMELANIFSMIDIMELKTRVQAHEANLNVIRAAIFDEINVLRKDLERSFKTLQSAKENNWYKLRDEFEAVRHKLNEQLFHLKEPIEQMTRRDHPGATKDGPIKSTK